MHGRAAAVGLHAQLGPVHKALKVHACLGHRSMGAWALAQAVQLGMPWVFHGIA